MIEDHSLDYELTCAEIQRMTPDTENEINDNRNQNLL